MDYQLKVKAKVYMDVISHDNYNLSTTVEVNVPIPEEKWESEMSMLVDEIEADIDNCDEDEEDFATGYIGTDGYVYDCSSSQTRMAYHLMGFGGDLATILSHCSALGTLRDAMVAELEANQPEKVREIQMLKDMKDLDSDDEDEKEEDWFGDNWERLSDKVKMKEMVVGEYPLDMLDELARRING